MAFPEVYREGDSGDGDASDLVGADRLDSRANEKAHCRQRDEPSAARNRVDESRHESNQYEKNLGIRQ